MGKLIDLMPVIEECRFLDGIERAIRQANSLAIRPEMEGLGDAAVYHHNIHKLHRSEKVFASEVDPEN